MEQMIPKSGVGVSSSLLGRKNLAALMPQFPLALTLGLS
jgi:hypothetical protein